MIQVCKLRFSSWCIKLSSAVICKLTHDHFVSSAIKGLSTFPSLYLCGYIWTEAGLHLTQTVKLTLKVSIGIRISKLIPERIALIYEIAAKFWFIAWRRMDCLFQANIGKYYYVDPEFAECYRIVWLWGRSGWNDDSGSSTKWWFCGNWRTFCMWSLLSLWHSMDNGMWCKPYLPIWQNTILLSLSPVLSIIIVLV